jgi:hypothetical protein
MNIIDWDRTDYIAPPFINPRHKMFKKASALTPTWTDVFLDAANSEISGYPFKATKQAWSAAFGSVERLDVALYQFLSQMREQDRYTTSFVSAYESNSVVVVNYQVSLMRSVLLNADMKHLPAGEAPLVSFLSWVLGSTVQGVLWDSYQADATFRLAHYDMLDVLKVAQSGVLSGAKLVHALRHDIDIDLMMALHEGEQ